MKSQDFSPPHVDASRPSLGFPLGAALLLIIILGLSSVFSCCYHWDKVRSFRRRRSSSEHPDPGAYIETSPSKSKLFQMDLKQYHNQGMPVVMPGDDVPKFIALPCPCAAAATAACVLEIDRFVKCCTVWFCESYKNNERRMKSNSD
uniref:Uncharacterized protein n=1 Tax=Populus alba TaxID=43335 RepID=A0A4U5QZA6_POPAL|nr:hypothetical protein D5086_0000022120 [Populus alba]